MIDKNYAPQEIEQKWYAYWLENKFLPLNPTPQKKRIPSSSLHQM